MGEAGRRRSELLERSRLYLVCDARPEGDLEQFLRDAFRGGVDIVQLRDKRLDDAGLEQAGQIFRRVADEYGVLFIVNDRPDLAGDCNADGVHVGQDDGSVEQVSNEIDEDMLVGLSTHSPEQVDRATEIDYFAVGPVYATPTKPTYTPVGLDLVRYAAGNATRPFFAIGGINKSNAADVASAGAQRIAVVRAIGDAEQPRQAAGELLDAIEIGARV